RMAASADTNICSHATPTQRQSHAAGPELTVAGGGGFGTPFAPAPAGSRVTGPSWLYGLVVTSASDRSEIPFEQMPDRWAEVVERAGRHEQLRLIRGEDAPALVVMTADDFDQAVEDAADLALYQEILARREDDPRPSLVGDAALAFLEEIAGRS